MSLGLPLKMEWFVGLLMEESALGCDGTGAVSIVNKHVTFGEGCGLSGNGTGL